VSNFQFASRLVKPQYQASISISNEDQSRRSQRSFSCAVTIPEKHATHRQLLGHISFLFKLHIPRYSDRTFHFTNLPMKPLPILRNKNCPTEFDYSVLVIVPTLAPFESLSNDCVIYCESNLFDCASAPLHHIAVTPYQLRAIAYRTHKSHNFSTRMPTFNTKLR
jgi:hypothetical protein